MTFEIIVDATCDAPEELIKKSKILPMYIVHGEKKYKVDEKFDRLEDFYKNEKFLRLWKEKKLKTSQPSIGDVIDVIESCDFQKILVITISSKLSGTYNVVCSARNILKRKGYEIEVIDSLTGSVGLGILLDRAVNILECGGTLLEAKHELEMLRKKIKFFSLHLDISYLLKSGRLSTAKYLFLKVIKKFPALTTREGKLTFYKLFNDPEEFISEFKGNLWIASTPKFLKKDYILASPILAINGGEFVGVAFLEK